MAIKSANPLIEEKDREAKARASLARLEDLISWRLLALQHAM